MARRRKRRITFIVAATAALLLGGGAIAALVATGGSDEKTAKPKATPKPADSPAPIACGAKPPPPPGSEKPTFSKPEDQKLNAKKTYVWRLDTSCGQIDIKLAVAESPKTANSIAFLTRKGYYDGLTFHRVVKGFVIQGGDPKGDGTGGPGYKVEEAPAKTRKYPPGTVAMAKAGAEPDGTSGSQFFIVSGDQGTSLPPQYAYVGQVLEGMSVVKAIEELAPGGDGPPTEKVYINKAVLLEQ